MNSCRTAGLVLNVSNYSESDKIVTFLSPELGKVTGIAKGAKRSKKRFVNKLEEFTLLQIMYRPSRQSGLLQLSEAELDNAFLGLRQAYTPYVAAMFVVELVLRLTRENDPDPGIFSLLHWSMQSLDEGRAPLETTALFHLKILGAAGYEPQLAACGLCGVAVSSGPSYALKADSGYLACSNCQEDVLGPAAVLTVQSIRFMQHAQRLDLHNLARLRLPRRNAVEILGGLQRYTRVLLQHDIISWTQLRRLFSPDPL